MSKVYLIVIVFVSTIAGQAQHTQTEKKKVLNHYLELYNDHQVDKLVQMVAEDFSMYSLKGDSMSTAISGRVELKKWLTGYFKSLPNVRSQISDVSCSGNYISFKETAYWGEGKSQSSLAVYEIVNEKIRRAWYYY